ncbi:putative protein phosphatase 2C 52 [Vitis vinifera]|uniref:protein-serine/threonine phosphatase n=1 Tax=Vitis vinifera TaxID=29760 RepID=A0A438GJA4_VITVI|nr:putative protein phosphatase 2C 52 [Vitis vinifera]
MVCSGCIRNVIVQAGHIGQSAVRSVRLRAIYRSLNANIGLRYTWNRQFRSSVKMMVDTAKGEPIINVLPEKEDDGGYASGGWKVTTCISMNCGQHHFLSLVSCLIDSEDRKLSCGYSSFRGKRASMEDFYDVKMSKIDGQTVCLFGIFDGHGGSRAAEFLKEHLFENLMKHPEFMTNTKLAIRLCFCSVSFWCHSFVQDPIGETYQQTDMNFLDAERDTYRDDGSTASTAVLVGNHLYVANVGDSRAVISKAGKAIPLSEDHKPNRSDERKRIENAGGVVMWAVFSQAGFGFEDPIQICLKPNFICSKGQGLKSTKLPTCPIRHAPVTQLTHLNVIPRWMICYDGLGTWRVGGVLAMSRAFGNRMLKQYVVAEPEIQDQEVDEELELLVLASDGLWDVVPNEDAIALARTEEEPEAGARKLTETAFTRGSADNITCIVVRFHHEKVDPDPPNMEQA